MSDWSLHLLSWLIMLIAIAVGAVLILATIWDMKRSNTNHSRRPRRWPPLTVLVDVSGGDGGLDDTLYSLRRARYPQLDVVVVDGRLSSGSSKQTRQLLSQMRFPVKLYRCRKLRPLHQVLYQGYLRSRRGDAVLVLDPGMVISGLGMRSAVMSVSRQHKGELMARRLPVRDSDSLSMETVVSKLVALSIETVRKAGANFPATIDGLRSGFVYPRQLISASYRSVACQHLDSSVIERSRYARGWSVRGQMTTILVVVMLLAAGGLALRAALAGISSTPLILFYSLTLFWLTVVVWADTTLPLRNKLVLSLTIPSAYAIMTATLAVRASQRLVQLFQVVVDKYRLSSTSKISHS